MYHKNLLTVEKTVKLIQKYEIKTKKEVIDLKNGNWRVLVQDIEVKIDVPPFNKSAIDGYAIIADDVSKASESGPRHLKVIDEVGAGDVTNHIVKYGEAIRIATGAKMPIGADAVVMEENIEYEKDKIIIVSPVSYNNDVAIMGEDLKIEELIMSKGQILGPHHYLLLHLQDIKRYKCIKNLK